MKPVNVEVNGYRRLAKVACNISPHLLAIVGKNEAGKSSLLDALEWLTNGTGKPLIHRDESRYAFDSDSPTVRVRYWLDKDDKASIEDLALSAVPSYFTFGKARDGTTTGAFTEDISRDAAPLVDARNALKIARETRGVGWGDEEDPKSNHSVAVRVNELLDDTDAAWPDKRVAELRELRKWLEQPLDADNEADEPKAPPASHRRAAQALADVERIVADHPRDVAIERLKRVVPRFIKYTDEDRVVPSETAIDANGKLVEPAKSTLNLLRIAGIDQGALAVARSNKDEAVEDLIQDGNAMLSTFFAEAWRQSEVTVKFKVDGSMLKCLLHDKTARKHTRIDERSEGMRAFIALAAFVESQNSVVPPVLLIDEAETHLHLDAQADLVGVLLSQLHVTQVIYTTHSPGCLPSDLGTSIRLVEPTAEDAGVSQITSHFWDSKGVGFSPLLYAMGAGAAAFSVNRRAVLAEGATEMILLPTLLRAATKREALEYQVAPGLAHANLEGQEPHEVAASVVFLADGDGDGSKYLGILKDQHVNPARLLALPKGQATEDLLEPSYYIEMMERLRSAEGTYPEPRSLKGSGPIATRLKAWARAQDPRVDLAGKPALAYAIIESDEPLRLTREGTEFLKDLHKRILAGFKVPAFEFSEDEPTAS